MCTVSVNARLSVNVALNRPSYQVSNIAANYLASAANDGIHQTDIFTAPFCAHTDFETNPWWAVDLTVALYVQGVKFTNRDTNGMCSLKALPCRLNANPLC